MKRIITMAAATALLATPVLAQMTPDYDNLIRTRDITGGDIFTLNMATDADTWNEDTYYDEINPNWNTIGEIEDIILDRNGQMTGIVAEVGGFLDIADKHVYIPLEEVRLAAVDDQTYAYVTRMSEEQLEQMESVDEGWWN
jgi:ABC-type amino acid transport substrate-binding protein